MLKKMFVTLCLVMLLPAMSHAVPLWLSSHYGISTPPGVVNPGAPNQGPDNKARLAKDIPGT